ncbi:transporter [Martelella soudanensis]|uniref:transporter n=1 Tax=unclassified Martelella TaxID=2629616 RepID=UPI0015DFAD51|nr:MULTISPECIES: transporter [unclassified Martelella]
MRRVICASAAAVLSMLFAEPAASQNTADTNTDMARKLANPLGAMIVVPVDMYYDTGYGPADGDRFVAKFKPIIPFELNDNWNLITRTIVPVVFQNDVFGPSGKQFGLGDTTTSLFLSPVDTGVDGLIWGAGPIFLLPTATDDYLGGEKWGAGPTAIIIKQTGPTTVGFLGSHVWSFAGNDNRDDVNATFLQPFITYRFSRVWSVGLTTETTYDWENDAWSVPVDLTLSRLVKFGDQPVNLTAGVRYWAETPDGGPDRWGARLGLSFIFPNG